MSFFQYAPVPRPGSLGFARVDSQSRRERIQAIPGWQDELEVAALRLAYEDVGGIGRGDEIGRLLADHRPGTFISMAQLVTDEDIFGFEWEGFLWLPMFQFAMRDLAIEAAPRQVRAELGDGFDGWALSAWFVEPNSWLAKSRPIDLIGSHLEAVLQAARADRFVATG